MHSQRSANLGGLALVAAGSVLLGTTGLFVVNLAELALPALLLWRLGLGGAGLLAILVAAPRLRRLLRAPREAWPHLVGLGLLLLAIDVGLYTAIYRVGIGLATILLYTAPLFVAGMSLLGVGERPTRRTLVGAAVGFAGVVLVARPDAGARVEALGLAGGLLAGTAWAGWLVVSRAAGERRVPGEVQSLASHVVGAAAVAPFALALGAEVPSGESLLLLLGLGLGVSALGLFMIARGLGAVDANRAAVVGYLEPVTAVVLGALALGERYGTGDALGSALVLMGTLIVTLSPTAAPIPDPA